MKNIMEQIKSLDQNNPGLWPIPFQLGLCTIILLGLLFAGGNWI